MSDPYGDVTSLIESAMSTSRRTDTGRPEGLEELARAEVRRYLDRASVGWSTRQSLIQMAETEIARRKG